jgi:hypothetical protein
MPASAPIDRVESRPPAWALLAGTALALGLAALAQAAGPPAAGPRLTRISKLRLDGDRDARPAVLVVPDHADLSLRAAEALLRETQGGRRGR